MTFRYWVLVFHCHIVPPLPALAICGHRAPGALKQLGQDLIIDAQGKIQGLGGLAGENFTGQVYP